MFTIAKYQRIKKTAGYNPLSCDITSTILGIEPILKFEAQHIFYEAKLISNAINDICFFIIEDSVTLKEYVFTNSKKEIVYFNAEKVLDDSFDVILKNGVKLKYSIGKVYEP